MEILFDAQLPSSAEPPAFSLTFDPEAMSLQCISDMAAITVQASMVRRSAFWNKSQFRGLDPMLFALQGVLYGSNNQGIGASLISSDIFPLVISDEYDKLLNLAFHCSRSYLQHIEEQRASNSNLTLIISLWTAMSLVPSASTTNENTIPMQMAYEDKLMHIKSRQGGFVSISRSHWSDMLSSINYPQRRYIELPTLARQEGAEEIHDAVAQLAQAQALFAQDRFREAVQRCRQARDVILGENKPTWAERVLAPIILDQKAAMINEGIKALKNLGDEASHGAGIEIDRDTASYVIGSLTLILDYIGRKLR